MILGVNIYMKDFSFSDKKTFPNSTGIYLITFKNSKSERVYIGSALRVNLKHKRAGGFNSRWRMHLLDFKRQKNGIKLQRAFDKYGIENLIFRILEETNQEFGLEREQFYINKFNSYDNGYNSRPLADNNLGVKHSIEIRKKQSDRQKEKLKKERDLVLVCWRQNKKALEISEILNISITTVYRILKENKLSPTKRVPHKGSKIFQYDRNGNKIKEWESIRAASRNLGICQQSISRIIKGKSIKNCNFIFKMC